MTDYSSRRRFARPGTCARTVLSPFVREWRHGRRSGRITEKNRYVKAAAERAHSRWLGPHPLKVLAGSERRLDLAGLHHESLRRVSDVVKGIAGNQREVGVSRGVENPDVLRVHDQRTADLVAEVAVAGRQLDVVADLDAFEPAEQAIAMRGQRAVAWLPRQRSVGKIAHGVVEYACIVAGLDRCRDLQPGDVESADQAVGKVGRVPFVGWLWSRQRS